MHEDLRIKKTKKALQKTLIELLSKKSFEDIRVAEICELSFINRSTFYAHYKDKYELFDDTMVNLRNDLVEDLSKNAEISNSLDYFLHMLDIFLNHIEENKDIYLPIFINNKNGIIMDMVVNALEKDLVTKLSNDDSLKKLGIPLPLVIKFYVGAIFYTGIEWLSNTNKYTKEDMQKYLNQLISKGIEGR